MNKYPVGSSVAVTIDLIDLNGDPVTPTGLSYSVMDENDEIVVDETDIEVEAPPQTSVEVVVPGSANDSAGARVISLSIQTATGTLVKDEMFALVNSQRLVVPENSFQTFVQSQLIAADMLNLDGWNAASDENKKTALIEAAYRLKRLSYLVWYAQDIDDQSRLDPTDLDRIAPEMWPLMTADMFNEYSEEFILALRKAQLAEANSMLLDNPISKKLKLGLLSESIGESSMMFRSGIRPVETTVCRDAMNYIGSYVERRFSTTRT